MGNWIFNSFKAWLESMEEGLRDFGYGLWEIVTSIILGIVSLLVYLWKQAAKFIGKYPNFALGGFIVIGSVIWILTFVSLKAKAVGAESQRDSISYEFSQFKEEHGYKDTTATLIANP